MNSNAGSNLTELDRLLLELNAVQQSTPCFPTTEEAPPPLPSISTTYYIQENGGSTPVKSAPPTTEKPSRNGARSVDEVRPSVESLLDELESSVPSPTPGILEVRGEPPDDGQETPAQQQARISASSATRELDELMACLSDFKPTSLASLGMDSMPEQAFTPPSALSAPSSASLVRQPARDLPLRPHPGSLEFLHIEEEGVVDVEGPALAPASAASRGSPLSRSPIPRSKEPESDAIIDVSASMLLSRLESLVVLSDSVAPARTVAGPSNLPGDAALSKSPVDSTVPLVTKAFSVPVYPAAMSPISQLESSLPVASLKSPVPPVSSSAASRTPPPVPTFKSEPSPAPGVSDAPAVGKQPACAVEPRVTHPAAQEPWLDEALDKLLSVSFAASEMPVEPLQEIHEAPMLAMDRRDVLPDMYTGTEGLEATAATEYGRELLDWVELELRDEMDAMDTSWMDTYPPSTPEDQLELPLLQPSAVERVSASGHIKSVICRTKETSNVHPMFREGHPRRKMGPLIFHKNSSQDKLIEELQGKLGIGRKERRPRLQDDWLTEGVVVMSRPHRTREESSSMEVDKIIIPPESPVPQRKVLPPPQSPPPPLHQPPIAEPKRPPPVKQAQLPVPPPPPPPPSSVPQPLPPKPPAPALPQNSPNPSSPPSPPKQPLPPPYVPRPAEPPVPVSTAQPPHHPLVQPTPAAPRVLVSTAVQTEEDALFPPMQIMAQGKGAGSPTGSSGAPPKEVNKLDNMLGSLQSDLNRLGVRTLAKGVCGACSKPIAGQVVTAMGRTWHPEHFVCTHCQEEIGSRNFFEREGQPYCERDYHSLFSPRCYYCNGPILDKVVTALEKTWHPEHFFCAQCGAFFGPEGFHEKDGKAYCRKDYFDMFAPKCGGCARAILENYISALNALWHPECFVCRECFTPFVNGSFFEHEGQPYCESHYHERRGSLCSGCQKPITGRCITAMGRKFHPEHFVCAFCLKQLNKGTFKEQNDKPYCQTCFVKLFS
uniref:Paxillin b n=1 Tax=Paramormyrops kingsleyae TaxID=1676925 RepID=A0A3B3QUS7_9TELE|nr:proline-rich protein 36-like isoform X1 [Paramormyrops kingsleyae]